MNIRTSLIAALFFQTVGWMAPAGANAADAGVLNAVSYHPLPATVSVQVRPLDNSDENIVLQEAFENALRDRSIVVSTGAPLILTFETRGSVGAWEDTGQRSFLELQAQGGRGGGEKASARVNLFDSNRGGLLNQGKGTLITTPSQYRLDATIDERSSGKRLWHAWGIADLGNSDGLSLTRFMVPLMVKKLGQTVRSEAFSVR